MITEKTMIVGSALRLAANPRRRVEGGAKASRDGADGCAVAASGARLDPIGAEVGGGGDGGAPSPVDGLSMMRVSERSSAMGDP
jgi:hypothetical protein